MIRSDVAAAAAGNEAALTALVRSYHARLLRHGQRVCRDPDDADDAVQEAFARLAVRPDVVEHPAALSWLMTVVRHTCARLLRPLARRNRTFGAILEEIESPSPTADEALARFEMIRTVHAAIAALPTRSREIVILRDLEGLSGPETCAALGIDLAAMKSRLHRARAELRAELARMSDREG